MNFEVPLFTSQIRALLLSILISLLSSHSSAAETGAITGSLVDQAGRAAHPGNAVVFLCDAESGMPIMAETKQPLVPELRTLGGIKDCWHAVTTDRGRFRFDDVPVGTYRLVAQAWAGTRGLPDFQEGKPSTVVVLHGVAERVEVGADEATDVYLRKLGDGVLKIVNDPEEGHAFLLISRNPRLGDGVLGPVAWGPEFLTGLIGVTQMEQPYVTLVGLPDDEQVHVGLFNYDNNPGVGGDSYFVGQGDVVRLDMFATWSNGKHEPPERLAGLTDYLARNDLPASSLIGLRGNDSENRDKLLNLLRTENHRVIHVDDVGDFTLADILAASAYRSLRDFHRERRTK